MKNYCFVDYAQAACCEYAAFRLCAVLIILIGQGLVLCSCSLTRPLADMQVKAR